MYVWSDYKLRDKCQECGHLSRFKNFKEECPKCGSGNYKKVTARWLYKRLNYLGGYHFKKSQVRGENV